MPIIWRHANDDRNLEMSLKTMVFFDPSEDKTQQSFKNDADLNVLVRRFGLTGQFPPPRMQPFFGDFTMFDSYHDAMNQIVAAREAFNQLPANVRQKFDNDPGKLWNYLHDPDLDVEEARELGLLKPEEAPPAPMRVQVVPDPSAPAPGASSAPAGAPPAPPAPGT